MRFFFEAGCGSVSQTVPYLTGSDVYRRVRVGGVGKLSKQKRKRLIIIAFVVYFDLILIYCALLSSSLCLLFAGVSLSIMSPFYPDEALSKVKREFV